MARTLVLMAIILSSAAVGQHDEPDPRTQKYCVTVPIKKMAEFHALIQGAKEDVGWRDERHLDRAFERLEQAENWLQSPPFSFAHVCPADSSAKPPNGD
jgi:hypothetical protein